MPIQGIYNFGNTCYLNSVVQVLRNTPFLMKLPLSKTTAETVATTVSTATAMLSAIQSLTDNVATHKQLVQSIRLLAAKQNHKQFAGSDQNDASELAYFLLDQLHQEYRRLPSSVIVRGNPVSERDRIAVAVYSAMKQLYEKERSPIMEQCYGMHVSMLSAIDATASSVDTTSDTIVTTNDATNWSITPEPYMIQHLPIPSLPLVPSASHVPYTATTKVTLFHCLELFLRPEQIQNRTKQFRIWSVPPIWSVCLSRFAHQRKNAQLVEYPAHISLAPYVIGYNPQQYQYRLYAVISHVGELNSGHYYAFVLDRSALVTGTVAGSNNNGNGKGQWYCCNDQAVSPITEGQALNHLHAYCLFYERINVLP
jgi:ubiquitin carboxyl-terminal hydrolase 22/27/51